MLKYLLELNSEDAKGDFVHDSPSNIINHKPEFFKNYQLILANNLGEKDLKSLGKIDHANK